MVNVALYSLTVGIWGTTWFAIKHQLGITPIEISIVLRFTLAAVVLLTGLLVLNKLQRLSWQDHLFCILQGACLFCFNFYAFYHATGYVTSGLVAVVFSLASVLNSANGWLWFGQRPTRRVLVGGLLGFAGVVSLFWPHLQTPAYGAGWGYGLALALLGTVLFSCGNMISVRHQRRGLRPPTTNVWSMLYGVIIMLGIVVQQQREWTFDPRPGYWVGLVYLALPGTVIGFTSYLLLVGRLGADKAGYCTVLFPVVALGLSTLMENYHWSLASVMGFGLVLLGNGVVFAKTLHRTPQ